MKTFSGFPDGDLKMSALPEMFYTGLLPLIDDLLELKVTLACFRLCWQKSGLVRWTTSAELVRDPALSDVAEEIAAGVMKAIRRGSLVGALDRSGVQYLFPNSELGQAAADAIKRGEKIESIPQIVGRPNIFVLYEQNIGPLTPLIAETLREAEATYPAAWIEEAVRIAVENNVRRWRYVQAILEDWRTKGRDEREDLRQPEAARRRYVEGEFADFIEH
jgi:DnaD/phage-associated family protein